MKPRSSCSYQDKVMRYRSGSTSWKRNGGVAPFQLQRTHSRNDAPHNTALDALTISVFSEPRNSRRGSRKGNPRGYFSTHSAVGSFVVYGERTQKLRYAASFCSAGDVRYESAHCAPLSRGLARHRIRSRALVRYSWTGTCCRTGSRRWRR